MIQYKMTRCLILGLSLFAVPQAASAQVTTTGAYDPADANDINVEAAGNPLTLSAWQTRLSQAFADNIGGTINFADADDFAQISGDTFNATYGTMQSKQVVINNGLAGSSDFANVVNASGREPTSAGGLLQVQSTGSDPSNRNDYSVSFGPITGGDVAEAIIEVALTVLSREDQGAYNGVAAMVTYSDNSTESRNFVLPNNTTTGRDDTLVLFQAPIGLSISNILVDLPTGSFGAVDDLAFITNGQVAAVPEPSSIALWTLLGMIGFGFALRRKWRPAV